MIPNTSNLIRFDVNLTNIMLALLLNLHKIYKLNDS